MTVRVTLAGSGDAFGSGGRLQACILVEDGASRVLLDCGATSLVALKRLAIDPNTIDVVALSHLHGDHFGGVPFLVLDGQFSRRETPLGVVGPPGTSERLTAAMEVLFPGSSGVQRRFELVVREIAPDESAEVRGGTVMAFAADHASGAPALHLRLELAGKTVAYSGDTAWTIGLVEAARGADLLICEAYSREKPVPYHLSYPELVRHKSELDCRRLILTHMTRAMIEAKDVEFERASDGMVIEL